jgi:hypothetical protein
MAPFSAATLKSRSTFNTVSRYGYVPDLEGRLTAMVIARIENSGNRMARDGHHMPGR